MAETLEDALNEAETMYNEQYGQQEIPIDTAGESVEPEEKTQNGDAQMMEQAVQTAEDAAQVASQANQENEALKQQIAQLQAQNQQLQGTIDEMSQQQQQSVVEEALTPPTLDINGLAFVDEDAQREALAKYAEDMSAYNRQQLMKEMAPAIEFAKKGMHDAEVKEVIAALSQVPELANIQEMLPQLDRIIANNKWLQSEDMPTDEKYINAYALAKGVDSINDSQTKSELTPEELLSLYNNNPEFQELVEKQRIGVLKQSQQVPQFSASSGAGSAALDIQNTPKTFEDSKKIAQSMLKFIK